MKALLVFFKKPRLAFEFLQVCFDILLLRIHYPFFRQNQAHHSGIKKKVLIVSLSDGLSQIKIETILAKSLQIQGADIQVLTRRHFHFAQAYFKSFGIDSFIFLDDWERQAEGANGFQELTQFTQGNLEFQNILEFTFQGVYVGRHVLSSIIREKKGCNIWFEDESVLKLCLSYLKKSLQLVCAAGKIYDFCNPDTVIFLERGYSPYGEFFDSSINRGFDTIQWLHAQRRDTIAMKRFNSENRHFHTFSIATKTWEHLRRMEWSGERDTQFLKEFREAYAAGTWYNRKFLHQGKSIKEVAEVRHQLKLDPHKKTAVIFSHVLWDATFFYGENLFKDYEDWLIETMKAAISNREVNWIVKVHPDYIWKMKQMGDRGEPADLISIRKYFGELPDHIQILRPETDISTYSLFNFIDYGITVRGTVGMELPCFGIPALTAGSGRYSNLGFTIDSSTKEEYLERIRTIHAISKLGQKIVELARKHAYALFFLRPLQFTSFDMTQRPLKEQGQLMDHNVDYKVRSWQELCAASDLKQFAHWCLESKEPDFLNGT